MGDNPDLKKNMGQLFFDEESIYEISQPSLKFVTDGRTGAWTEGQAKGNMPLQLFQSWGHKNVIKSSPRLQSFEYILP